MAGALMDQMVEATLEHTAVLGQSMREAADVIDRAIAAITNGSEADAEVAITRLRIEASGLRAIAAATERGRP